MISVIEHDPWWEVMTPRGNLVARTTSAPEALRIALHVAFIRGDDNIIFSPINPLGN